MAKGKNKQGGRPHRLNKAQLTDQVMNLFQSRAGEVIDIKTIFRELHLNTHSCPTTAANPYWWPSATRCTPWTATA